MPRLHFFVCLAILTVVAAIDSTPEGINTAVQSLTNSIADQTSRVVALDSDLYSLATKQEAAELDSTLQAISLTQQNALSTSDVSTVQNQVSQQFDNVNNALTDATAAEKLLKGPSFNDNQVLPEIAAGNVAVTRDRKQLLKEHVMQTESAKDKSEKSSSQLDDQYSELESNSIQGASDRIDQIIEMLGGDDLDIGDIVQTMAKYPGYSTSTHAVHYRWKRFATSVWYSGCSTCYYWMMGNSVDSFGGTGNLNPSDWSSYPYAYEFQYGGMQYVKSLFTETGHGSSNLNAESHTERTNSYNEYQSKYYVALFRIENTTPNSISHRFRMYWTNYGSYNQAFSVSLGPSSIYSYTSNCYMCDSTITINFPPNKVSNMVVAAGHGPFNSYKIANIFGIYDNTMNLPQGLRFVDDLDAASVF